MRARLFCRRGLRARLERWVLLEDRLLESLELSARLEAELVGSSRRATW